MHFNFEEIRLWEILFSCEIFWKNCNLVRTDAVKKTPNAVAYCYYVWYLFYYISLYKFWPHFASIIYNTRPLLYNNILYWYWWYLMKSLPLIRGSDQIIYLCVNHATNKNYIYVLQTDTTMCVMLGCFILHIILLHIFVAFFSSYLLLFNNYALFFPSNSPRLTITASCPMNLQYFPMDRQLCYIEIESCEYFRFEKAI